MFKILLLGLLCFSAQAYDETDLDETDHKCLKELGYDKSIVISSYDKDEFIQEGNEKMNTFFACAWKKDGLQKEDGSINVVNLQKIVELKLKKAYKANEEDAKALAQQSVAHCKDIKGSNNGDTCVKIYNCLLKKIAELFKND